MPKPHRNGEEVVSAHEKQELMRPGLHKRRAASAMSWSTESLRAIAKDAETRQTADSESVPECDSFQKQPLTICCSRVGRLRPTVVAVLLVCCCCSPGFVSLQPLYRTGLGDPMPTTSIRYDICNLL